MKSFTQLFTKISQTKKIDEQVAALVNYFHLANEKDMIWTIALLSQYRPKRTVSIALLRQWALEVTELPNWLFEASYQVVGEKTETVSLILPKQTREAPQTLTYWIHYLKDLSTLSEIEKKEKICDAWANLDKEDCFVFNKLLTGGFRMDVPQKVMVKALAVFTQIEESILAHRLTENWTPDTTTFYDLILSESILEDSSKPYTFKVTTELERAPTILGNPLDWQVERQWDGIRGQIIIRAGAIFVWSSIGELVTDKYPEYQVLANLLPSGTVIDGAMIAFKDGRPLAVNKLQTRIGRKRVTKKYMQEIPIVLVAYDLLEWQGKDIRNQPLVSRREKLAVLVKNTDTKGVLLFSDEIPLEKWEDLEAERIKSRQYNSIGLIFKKKNSVYHLGKEKDRWWTWKTAPLRIHAVLIYAEKGVGEQANLYTKYTFAVWDGEKLVPFTKADANLTDKEINAITQFVKKNTLERFGPVRSVQANLVFEISFDGIMESKRPKSGVVLRAPKISCWLKGKEASEANTLKDLKRFLQLYQ